MANAVFANGREIACKAAAGKTICAMPDVCFTPPENPATPPGVPIPYPNTGMASDTTDGSKKVKISDKEVGLKNKSSFKKSMGDEAGVAAKKGVITSKNTGKVFFNAWSMDVKIEGQNAVRHLDLTTNNHGSVPGDTPCWPYIDSMDTYNACEKDFVKEAIACGKYKDGKDPCDDAAPKLAKPPKTDTRAIAKPKVDEMADRVVANDCLNARRCQLSPYKEKHNAQTCCPGQTPHHIVDKAFFGEKKAKDLLRTVSPDNKKPQYSEENAPCVCAEGTGHSKGGTHELMHCFTKTAIKKANEGVVESTFFTKSGTPVKIQSQKYGFARETGLDSFEKTFPDAGCSRECLKAQIDAYHNQCQINDDTDIKATETGPAQMTDKLAIKEVAARSVKKNLYN